MAESRSYQGERSYYLSRRRQLLEAFDAESRHWRPFLATQYGDNAAASYLLEAREAFDALLPDIPYIGGDENHLTWALVESARYLALYEAMQRHGRTAEETGKVLYDAAVARRDEPPEPIPPSELMQRRRLRAERSQERRYPADYVYEFVVGDGVAFDYGYDFSECAAQKFYHAQDADEFMPFYCYLDFAKSRIGLRRTMTLAEGDPKCNHRFKEGRAEQLGWPPPFMRQITERT
ncbi:MAG: L-2-amino-thiazoline-4-carboxylic acid hydrolase [Anaerolineae bacterium]